MPSKPSVRKSSNTAVLLLFTAFFSGSICYRIGQLASCASPWLAGMSKATLMMDSPSYALSGSTLPRPNDRRTIPRPQNSTYSCGVVFFYHIPCTGGRSINLWLQQYQQPEMGNMSYYQYWELETRKDGSFNPRPKRAEARFNAKMDEHIKNLGPKEWRIAHSHLSSTYLNESEHVLNKWRADVEAQGCEMINTVMLRDPLNHAMSLYKIIPGKNSSREEWTKHLNSPTEQGLWATILDFFLYNNHGARKSVNYPNGPGGRNPFNVTKEVKVARAMELLHRHFDIVTLGDHAKFTETLLSWTGWKPIRMPHANSFRGKLRYTKKEVETLQKLLEKNGDFDFADQVKYEYHDHLSYLGRAQWP